MATTRQSKIQELVRRDELRYVMAERRLSHYARGAWSVLEPKTELKWNWHLDLECEALEAVKLRQIKRLIINVPPRSLKSTLATVCFPTWVWIDEAHERFLYTSYNQILSTKHSVDRRTLIQSEWYQTAWADRYAMATDQNEKMRFNNDKRGHMIATSMGGAATGDGGNILGIDDPHDTTIAASKKELQTTLDEFDQKFTSRLNDKENGAIIIIMQRLAENDLTGHVIAKELGYHHIRVPAIEEARTKYIFPISKKVVEREVGDILHPARESKEILDMTKLSMGSRAFAGQYQQNPAPAEGSLIKREWIKFYRTIPKASDPKAHMLPEKLSEQIDSWDMAFKDSDTSDYVAAQSWGRSYANCYLVDRLKERLDFPATIKAFKKFTARHPKVNVKLVEEKANGAAVIQSLKSEINGIVPVIPKESKEARGAAISPMWEAGNVYLPHPDEAPWVLEYIEEIVGFPKAKNDDEFDCMTQALWRLKKSAGAYLQKLVTL